MTIRTSLIAGILSAGMVLFNLSPVSAAHSYEDALKEKVSIYEEQAREDLSPYFQAAGVPYASTQIKFLAFKAETLFPSKIFSLRVICFK